MSMSAKFMVARKIPLGVVYDLETKQWKKQGAVNAEDQSPWAYELELTPDYVQGRNSDWASATPSGVIRLTIKNELAADEFIPGEAWDVLFTRNPDQPQ